MAFRFRKSIKVLPGVRLNVGKRGASVSVGTRGARVTVGPRGTTTSLGIPGTGLSYRSRSSRGRGGSSGGGSPGSGSAGLLGGLVVLCFFASCAVCVCSGGGGSSAKRSTGASVSSPASEPEEPKEQEQGLAASAPAVVRAFGDGAACRALGSCRVLERPSNASGITWRLASASNVSDARIELLVTPDGSRIAAVGITGDSSGDLATLVLGDLDVRESDRPALAWHLREHLRTGALEKAKPLCAVGLCVMAGLDSGAPAIRFRLDHTITADMRSMKRAARAAARAAEHEARRPAEERPSVRRSRPRALEAEPRRRANEDSAPSSPSTRTCCKYCTSGIPCGDTCIAANRTCHKGRGCAC